MKEPFFSQQFWLNRGLIADQQFDNHSWIDELDLEELLPSAQQNEENLFGGVEWQSGSASSLHAADKPLSLYLPDRYESNYDYPLIVWLHSDNSNEEELLNVMPHVSDQNYMAIGFRGNRETTPGCTWGNSNIERALFFSELHDTLRELRREFRIHADRIYLAGMESGATLALQGVLHHPKWFAGAIAINGSFSHVESPLAKFRRLDEQRLLLIETITDQQSHIENNETIQAGRLLHSAGVDTTSEIYNTTNCMNPPILARINHWIMQSIKTAW